MVEMSDWRGEYGGGAQTKTFPWEKVDFDENTPVFLSKDG